MIDPRWGKFRKRPVVVDAFRWAESLGCCIPQIDMTTNGKFFIRTLEGPFTLRDSDWVIRGVKGELYSCRPDIFQETYQPVTEVKDE